MSKEAIMNSLNRRIEDGTKLLAEMKRRMVLTEISIANVEESLTKDKKELVELEKEDSK